MPDNVTEIDAFSSPVVVSHNTELWDQAAILQAVQPLANRTVNLRKGIPGIAASFTSAIPLIAVGVPTTWDHKLYQGWPTGGSSGGPYWLQNSVSAPVGNDLFIELPMLGVGIGKIDSIVATVDGRETREPSPAGAHAALPSSMPQLGLYSDVSGQIANTTDTSASVAAYDAVHTISLTGLGQSIASGTRYFIRLRGESGSNSQILSLALLRIDVTFIP